MAQGINDRDVSSRDTKKKAFESDPNSGRVGALATMGGNTDTTQTASVVGDHISAPTSIGDLASPSVIGTEPPPGSADELNARVSRNVSFLQDPQVKAQMMQFGLSMLGSAGRGNAFSNIGNAIMDARQLPARTMLMNQKYNKTAQEMDIAERNANVNEGEFRLHKAEFATRVIKEGGTQFTKVISPDDPLNEYFNLGLKPGDKPARVNFLSDANGKMLKVENLGPYEAGNDLSIEQLLKQSDDAYKAGNPTLGNLLKVQAQAKATGAGGITGEGQILQSDPNSPTGMVAVNIGGSKADIAAKAAADVASNKQSSQIQKATTVIDRIDKAVKLIDNSIEPDMFVTGIGEYLSYLPATEAKDMHNLLDTIKANITVEQLSQLRAESKTGAAVGNVSNFEDELFGSMLGSLDQGMKASSMRENLLSIRTLYDDIINKGTLSTVGRLVDQNLMTKEEGFQHAAELLSPEGINIMSPQESDTKTGVDEAPIPLPDAVPGLTKDQHNRIEAQWPKMDNAHRRSFLNADRSGN